MDGDGERLNIDLDADKDYNDESFGEGSRFEGNDSDHHEEMYTGVTSIHFQSIDPIGTVVVAFDNGVIKVWRSSVKNEALMKIRELH